MTLSVILIYHSSGKVGDIQNLILVYNLKWVGWIPVMGFNGERIIISVGVDMEDMMMGVISLLQQTDGWRD